MYPSPNQKNDNKNIFSESSPEQVAYEENYNLSFFVLNPLSWLIQRLIPPGSYQLFELVTAK